MTTLTACLAALVLWTPADDPVDELVKAEMARAGIPGVALLITQDDKVVKEAAYGVSDLKAKTPMRPAMVFESGSIGKSFTATVILKLWEQGKLDLDAPVTKYIDKAPALWSKITLRNMLGHTSGLADYAVVEDLTLTGKWTTDKWYEVMAKQPLDFKTGERFAYSNSNYLLLGQVAEKVTGKNILDLTQEWVFKPLGMDRSHPSDGRADPDMVKGYWQTKPEVVDEIVIPGLYGDGSMVNTCADLAKFERGLREGKILKPASVELMQQTGRLPNRRRTNYGFGWFDRVVYGHRYISHGGNTGGFGASMTRVPDKRLTIVVLTNLAQVSGDTLAQRIAFAVDKDLGPKPTLESPDPDAEFSKRLRASLESLAKGETNHAMLEQELQDSLKTGRGQMVLGQYALFKPGIDSFSYCSTEDSDIDKFLKYRVKVGKRSFIVGFVVTSDKKVLSVALKAEN